MSSKISPTLKSSKIRVGIALGDPSGIGAAIIPKALKQLKSLARFTIIGSFVPFQRLKLKLPKVDFIDLANIDSNRFSFGRITPEYGKASIEYLDKALELIKQDKLDCLVTLPVSKEAVNLSGLKFSGHTEYLAGACAVKDTVMMLLNRDLKFSLATRHIPLKEVTKRLTKVNLENNILMVIESLKKLFGIKKPRIVVCGLNPHASDNGVIGDEESRVIVPALKMVRHKAFIEGPMSADIAVALAKNKKYDCVIAMYHDQALIPLKLTSFETGVNLTLGLPFVRTSPLHGTAFDIASQPNKADPGSLIAAIKLAVECTLNRKKA
ncbi:MAG: 4-hydroxythreonine-4-phosphate dehydrogenase PdxA [Candidatus Omnitrophota bacterium]|jgi:4-hydroxythreonine-4-phosphate dehydrogenase